MNIPREKLEQWRDALSFYANPTVYDADSTGRRQRITFVADAALSSIEAELEQPQQQQPVHFVSPVPTDPSTAQPDYSICPSCGGMASDPIVPPHQRGGPAWIPVSERLPEDDCRVLAATWTDMTGEQQVEVVSFRRGTGKFSDNEATHWQPLPAAPSDGGAVEAESERHGKNKTEPESPSQPQGEQSALHAAIMNLSCRQRQDLTSDEQSAFALGHREARHAAAELVAAAQSTAQLTEQQAYDMGAKGGPISEGERLLFEAWMRGHCWALCAEWDGTGYRSHAEQGGDLDPRAMATRRLWAAWRDRAALSAQSTALEPVAWMKRANVDAEWDAYDFSANQHGDYTIPLFATPEAAMALLGEAREALDEAMNYTASASFSPSMTREIGNVIARIDALTGTGRSANE